MTLSPMQQDYVSKKDFRDFKTDVDIRFENIEDSIKDLKTFTKDGFYKMEEYMDNSFVEFGKQMDEKFKRNKTEIIEEVNKGLDERFERNKNEIIKALTKNGN